MSRNGYGIATGKIILIGEHAVVFGKPAIALPFYAAQIETFVSIIDDDHSIDCSYYTGKLQAAPDVIEGIKILVHACMDHLGIDDEGVHVSIQSALPAQRGLGSSAAVSVSVVRAVFDAFQRPLSDDVLVGLVGVSESVHHLNPSGLDANTIASGLPVYYQREQPMKQLALNMDAYLVVADSGQRGQTKEAVLAVRQAHQAYPDIMDAMLNRLGELSMLIGEALENDDADTVGISMNEAHEILARFGVSTNVVDRLIASAHHAGAIGAKLTGSGMGGCIVALCTNFTDALKVESALRAAGAVQTWQYHLKEMR